MLWRYRRPIPAGVILMHPVTRGVALIDDKVIFATNINVVVALDARTGKHLRNLGEAGFTGPTLEVP